ncbi:MAG: hypothetical protein IT349_20775 [Candidatus Eisenbacteria bacterium]|nr:hypothetical protein [Candidatus Eisenbacteria bacterium]
MASTFEQAGATRVIHFRDSRPPQEIQFLLERDLMALFAPVEDEPRLTLTATMPSGSLVYRFWLRFEAAMASTNAYSLRAELTHPVPVPMPSAELQPELDRWLSFWTRDFAAANPPAATEGSEDRYRQLVAQARSAETHLGDVPSIQQEIVRRMCAGCIFRTAHKEGGTEIRYWNGGWLRADYGEWSTRETFRDEAKFLRFLRQFYDWETSRNVAPNKLADYDAWKLILRLLAPPEGLPWDARPGGGRSGRARIGTLLWGLAVAAAISILFARARAALDGHPPSSSLAALVWPALGLLGVSVTVAVVWLGRNWR